MKNTAVQMARDPVCGMTVDPSTAAQRAEHAGITRHFCGAGCAAKFRKDTACAVPKCGMALKRAAPAAAHPRHSGTTTRRKIG